MNKKNLSLAIGLISLTLVSFRTLNFEKVKDYLSIGKNLPFDNEKYELKWSSHPTVEYYKQEYLREGENFNSFRKMLMIDAMVGDIWISDAVEPKLKALEKRKQWDFVCNYTLYENEDKKNEAIIDFVVSDTGYIYEWNLYRYQLQKKENKNNNILVVFSYVYRDSLNDNEDLKRFFGHIKENRIDMINKLQEYSIPQISGL